METIILSRASV